MEKKWYVVHTYSGFETKVKQSIEKQIEKKGLGDRITQVLVPTEKVIDLKKGKRKETEKKFFPGYILVEMELDDETWHLVRNIPKVSGFVGGTSPVPIPAEEVEMVLQQIEKGPSMQVKTQFGRGDEVRIIDGPFSNFTGHVEEVDADHARLRVLVSIFGRPTPVELNFFQVEKV
ncbi:MAG: transcription termination/antitermination protein NusG [Thermodesulfovibrionales bacterium]|nr:transcription termination/antitermination protein NusG [Thermodesulfovibrionales bacterium]